MFDLQAYSRNLLTVPRKHNNSVRSKLFIGTESPIQTVVQRYLI